MKLRLSADLVSGVIFCSVGAIGIALSSGLNFGSSARMGPGFFPMHLSVILVALGAIVLGRAIVKPGDIIGDFNWRPLVTVLVGVALFGLAVDRIGFVLAALILVLVARLAVSPFKPVETLLLAAGLIAVSAGIFIVGLKLPMRLWPI